MDIVRKKCVLTFIWVIALHVYKILVNSVFSFQKFFMASFFNGSSITESNYLVGILNG